ncbi:MAG TPA: 3-hydroxyacyl-CoA dehydrogenase NAD-binding domain-containing protein [Vicinamibacterales bacterium]|nr:3-hydroxyacyl-CoA dehydrogenase NAD-binding domain-containing protein [Vicinamibacterales bacterium]
MPNPAESSSSAPGPARPAEVVHRPLQSVAVLGAGTMGAQIAAHVANAGIPVLLLDLTAAAARDGLARARRLKPDPFFTAEAAGLIQTGGFDTDLPRLASYDWIVEAIVERLDVKQGLLEQVERYRTPGTIVSSNTSGIPLGALAEGRSADFRRCWLGTHFFNPPRYLKLLELVPTADTSPSAIETVSSFADHWLGKGVVVARDTPNFIANRIGLYGVMRIFESLSSGRYTIEEIDALTGPLIGRPKSATFRTVDITGLDILCHVARNLVERMTDETERRAFTLPPLVEQMLERGWIGEKTGQGFYKREKTPQGETQILTLDPPTMTYRERQPVRLPELEAARAVDDLRERLRMLFASRGRAGAFLRDTLAPTLLYTAKVAPEIAGSIDDIDRAMQWGFGWDLGPFETWDAIGVRDLLESMQKAQPTAVVSAPPIVDDILKAGRNAFRDAPIPPAAPDLQILRAARDRSRVVRSNAGASLIDLGDGVLAIEFHSKMNTIGADIIEMIRAGLDEAARNFAAIVVGNDAANFSAGANLMLLLLEAEEENWDEIDLMVRTFQSTTQALRYAPVPVIVCPAGLTLGGGCEIALYADRVQAAGESYIGLVEVGVGLIPGGGGTTAMVARAVEALTPEQQRNLLAAVRPAFETMALGRVSTSGPDARRLGYLRDLDGVTMNRDRLMADAKRIALERVREGYHPPARRDRIPVGGDDVRAALSIGVHLAWRAGQASDHDALIGRMLARIMAGGDLPHATTVSEQYLLDLEREAFLKLCGEPKTQARIRHTLKTGKTLRN